MAYPPFTALTIFCAASSRSSAGSTLRPESRMICLPASTLVPSRRTTSGTFSPTSFTAATTPSAMTSHFMMPPKMLTRMPFTLGSAVMIFNAAGTLSLLAAPADVEEIRRRHAVELDDVHRRHGKAGAVHHAADIAVEGDVVEIVMRGLDFLGVLLGLVAQRRDFGMPEQRVVVERHLGVEHAQIALFGHHQRVDLQHRHVLGDEGR